MDFDKPSIIEMFKKSNHYLASLMGKAFSPDNFSNLSPDIQQKLKDNWGDLSTCTIILVDAFIPQNETSKKDLER